MERHTAPEPTKPPVADALGLTSGRTALLGALLETHGKRASIFALNFAVAKAITFLAPPLMAILLSADTYASIETALSASLLIANVLSLGAGAALPRLILRRRPLSVTDFLGLHLGIGGLSLVLAASVAAVFTDGILVRLVFVSSVASLAQIFLSSFSRASSKRNWAVWLDGLATLTMSLTVLVLYQTRHSSLAAVTGANLLTAAAIAIAGLVIASQRYSKTTWLRWRLAIRFGLPLLAYGLLSMWIVVSGRILIPMFLSMETAAAYAFDFRIASVAAVFHAMVATGLFAKTYTMTTADFDHYISIYLGMLSVVASMVCIAFAAFSNYLPGEFMSRNGSLALELFPIVSVQVYAWLAGALIELRLNREGVAGKASLAVLAVSIAIVISICAIHLAGFLSAKIFALALAAQSALIINVNIIVLSRKGPALRKIQIAATAGCALILLTMAAH